jgi:hypothetical protein
VSPEPGAGPSPPSEDAHPGEPAAPAPERRSVARRVAPLVIALGVTALLSPLADRWPSSHPLEVTLDAPRAVRRVDVIVRREGDDIHQVTWNFAEGGAPDRLHTTVQAPEGAVEILVDVERRDGARTSRPHRVELGEGRTVLHDR